MHPAYPRLQECRIVYRSVEIDNNKKKFQQQVKHDFLKKK